VDFFSGPWDLFWVSVFYFTHTKEEIKDVCVKEDNPEKKGPDQPPVKDIPAAAPIREPAFGSGRRKQEIQVTTDLFFFLPKASPSQGLRLS